MAEFNTRLKEAFRFSGKSQQDLVDYLKVNKSVVSTWVGGRNTPNSVEKMVKIANFFEVNPAWLAGYDIPRTLTAKDIEFLKQYKEINESAREIIDATLRAFLPQENKEDKKLA